MKSILPILLMFCLLIPAFSGAATPFGETDPVLGTPRSGSAASATVVSLPRFFDVADPVLRGALAAQNPTRVDAFYRPIGDWTGRLIFPNGQTRQSDGSVLIAIRTSPIPSLLGKKIRLRWDTGNPRGDWYESIRPDVRISAETIAGAKKFGALLPLRLNGLDRVSALESLAGSRPVDDVEVLLENPRFDGTDLYIHSEPVQIVGSRKALVRFTGAPKGAYRQIEHFDPALGGFNPSAREWAHVLAYPGSRDIPLTSTAGIEKSALNTQGWYAFGRRIDGVFHIEALEPRALMLFQSTQHHFGKEDVATYLKSGHFEHLSPGLIRRVFANPAEKESALAGEQPDRAFVPGRKELFVHLFGWQDTGAKKGFLASLAPVNGHFAFGTATLEKDEFTGEDRWNLTYRQVYAHNREGILSGAHAWHSYMGSLTRGWANAIPVWDSIIAIPELQPYQFGEVRFDPFVLLCRELDKMMAVYRTGAGTGFSSVGPDVSCVQDSNCALYSALKIFEEGVAKDPRLQTAMGAAGRNDPEVRRFRSLQTLANGVERFLTPFGIARWDWRKARTDLLAVRKANPLQSFLRGVGSITTAFPRAAQDFYLDLARKRGYPFWVLLSAQIGGTIDGITPVKPTLPLQR